VYCTAFRWYISQKRKEKRRRRRRRKKKKTQKGNFRAFSKVVSEHIIRGPESRQPPEAKNLPSTAQYKSA